MAREAYQSRQNQLVIYNQTGLAFQTWDMGSLVKYQTRVVDLAISLKGFLQNLLCL